MAQDEPHFTDLNKQLLELYCTSDPSAYKKCLIQPAGQHILLNGHYTFQSSNEIIDLDELVAWLKLG